jgi:hypothetical protein
VTICPCCGFKFEGTLSHGCVSCGARSVGEALPKPEHELPSYGRALLLAVTGSLMVLVFLTQTIISLVKLAPPSTPTLALSSVLPLDFWLWLTAGETAAWHLKWIAIPVTIIVLWGSLKIYRSMLKSPARFCGLGYAKAGLVASALVPMLIAVLIGVTVPQRLRERQDGIQAGLNALGYASDRVLFQYRKEFGTLPSHKNDLARLPDPDGSIAALLKELDSSGYKATAEMAARQKPQLLRGAVIRNASLDTAADDTISEVLSLTNYELQLPGADKLLGTEDDLIVRDGVIIQASESVRRPGTTNGSTKSTKP